MNKKVRLTESQLRSVVTSRMLNEHGCKVSNKPEVNDENKKTITETKQIDVLGISRIREIMGL